MITHQTFQLKTFKSFESKSDLEMMIDADSSNQEVQG